MFEMKVSLAKKRIKQVFEEALKRVEAGRNPNVFQLMKKYGYSEKQAKKNAVTQTVTWQELLNEINDGEILSMFKEIIKEKKDKRARIAAGIELLKLKNRYPKESTEIEAGELKIIIRK